MYVANVHLLLVLSLVVGVKNEESFEPESVNVPLVPLLEELDHNVRISKLEETVDQQTKLIAQHESERNLLKEALSALEVKLAVLEAKLDQANLDNGKPSATTELFLIPRTCDELRNLNPLARSGVHTIDPDGHGNGEEPIQAYCNMTSGTTEIEHDSLDSTAVSRCSAPGCFSKTIQYKASMNQIAALINLSKTCKQRFQYDCFAAPFEFKNRNYAWWNDRHGVSRYTWAGDNATLEHTCDCGLTNTCIDNTLKCNCDSFAPELQTDYGYITDMASLPVMQVYFGRILFSSSKGVFTLGRLECSGKHQLKSQPESCEDLWRAGNTFSGVYTLKAKNGFDAVFCDFSKVPNESGFETRIGNIGIQTSEVIFKAHMDTGETNAGEELEAEQILTNEGSSLKSDHFQAPANGVYYIYLDAWTPEQRSGHHGFHRHQEATRVSLRKNGHKIGIFKETVELNKNLFLTAVLALDEGDKVSVVVEQGNLYSGSNADKLTEFGGILIKRYPNNA